MGAWMNDCSAVVVVLGALGRIIWVFYNEIYFSWVTRSRFILTVSRVLPHVPPHQIWLNVSVLLWSRFTHFIYPYVVLISVLSLCGPPINRAGTGWKEFFLEGKKLLHVQFCMFKGKWDGVCGVTCHTFGLQVAWPVSFSAFFFHEYWVFSQHSLSCMTTDWVSSRFATEKYPLYLWLFQRRQAERIKYFWTSISYSPESRGEILVLGIQRVPLSLNFCNNSSYRVSWFNQDLWGEKKKGVRVEQSIPMSEYYLIWLKLLLLGQRK